MSRLAGKVIQINIDRFSIELSRVSPKEVAMEQLVRQMERDCSDCVGCSEVKLHEQDDHMRMAKLFAVTCKQQPRNTGDIVRCPDGFFGMYDASAKEVRQVKLEVPTVTTASLDMYDPKATMPAPSWVTVGADRGTFEREFLTRPMLEEEGKGVSKISAGLASFGPGSTTGLFARDALLKPATKIPTDRSSFPPVRPRNKDVPMTTEEDTW